MKRFAIIASLAIVAWSLAVPASASGCRRCVRPLVVTPAPARRSEVLMAPVVTRQVWVVKRRWFGRGWKLIPRQVPFVVVPPK